MKPAVIAHRGSSGQAPENTAAAFELALEQGAEGVEFDVHLSRDGIPVVIHDEMVDRTTDGKGLVKDKTLAELKDLDAGSWYDTSFRNQQILTLTETLEIVREFSIINIELKSGVIPYPGLEEIVIRQVKDLELAEKTRFSSFNHYSLYQCKQLAPSIKTGVLYMAGLYQPWQYASRLRAEAIHPYYYSVAEPIVAGCHRAGIEVNVFTVNNEEEIRRIINISADGLITDFPKRAIQLREGDIYESK